MITETRFGHLALAPNPLKLEAVRIKVLAVEAEVPDTSDLVCIDVRLALSNQTQTDWAYLIVQLHILNDMGQPIREEIETFEETLQAGEKSEFKITMQVNWELLGERPELADVLVNVMACGAVAEDIGEFAVPDRSLDMVEFKPVKLGRVLQLVKGFFSKQETANPSEAYLAVRALVQNLTPNYLHEVKIVAEVTDTGQQIVSDMYASIEMPPGTVMMLYGMCFAEDEKQFRRARLRASLRAYFPIANGIYYHAGLEIIERRVVDD